METGASRTASPATQSRFRRIFFSLRRNARQRRAFIIAYESPDTGCRTFQPENSQSLWCSRSIFPLFWRLVLETEEKTTAWWHEVAIHRRPTQRECVDGQMYHGCGSDHWCSKGLMLRCLNKLMGAAPAGVGRKLGPLTMRCGKLRIVRCITSGHRTRYP